MVRRGRGTMARGPLFLRGGMTQRVTIWAALVAAWLLQGMSLCGAAPLRVMPLGDSITAGYPFEAQGGYRTRLWQRFGSDPTRVDFLGTVQSGPAALGDKQHEGHSGFTIGAAPRGVGFGSLTQLLPRWLGPTVNPDVILLMIGTNDVNLNVDLAAAPARLGQLLSLIADPATGLKSAAKLIVSTIPPIDDARNQYRSSSGDFSANERVAAFNAALPGLVAAHRALGERVFFADIGSQFALADIYDGLHPTAAAYNKLGDAWYEAIVAAPEPGGAGLMTAGAMASAGAARSGRWKARRR